MPLLLFQIALILIIVHAVVSAFQNIQGSNQNWFEVVYQVAIAVAALWFLLDNI